MKGYNDINRFVIKSSLVSCDQSKLWSLDHFMHKVDQARI